MERQFIVKKKIPNNITHAQQTRCRSSLITFLGWRDLKVFLKNLLQFHKTFPPFSHVIYERKMAE